MPTKTYIYDKPSNSWLRSGMAAVPGSGDPVDPDPTEEGPDSLYRPVSYASVAEARTALDAPADANYVMWDNSWTDIEQAFAALAENDILVLPERAEPYWIDSSNGFMAAGVKEVDGTDSNGNKDGSRVPVVSNSRLWFAMARARRGILGMGPGVTIAPTDSGFTAPRQPILTPSVRAYRYMLDGSTSEMVGTQEKLIEVSHTQPFFANFKLQGRDFGDIAYSGLSLLDTEHATVKRIFFDGCWRGFDSIPNGETGALGFWRGTYLLENCDFVSDNGPSPVMWNRNTGGVVRNARSSTPNNGMWTFWQCGGVNTFENVWLDARSSGVNLEKNDGTFLLDWTGGKIHLNYTVQASMFHVKINPENGSNKVRLKGVDISPNGYQADKMCATVYLVSGIQKKSDVTCDTLEPIHVPGSRWIE